MHDKLPYTYLYLAFSQVMLKEMASFRHIYFPFETEVHSAHKRVRVRNSQWDT